MGGQSSQQSTQQSTTNPWAPAQGMLQSILGQVGGNLNNTGVTGQENSALSTMQGNANAYTGQYAPQIGTNATALLNGGGAQNQAGAVNQNYQNYQNATQPVAFNMNYDPTQNPGTAALLARIQGDVGNSVNSMFAGAGRDLSGANQMAYGRGIAQGEAPVLFDQYNANRTAQQGAAGNLYNAGNTNAGILSGMQQQALQNQQVGTGAATQALDAQNTGASAAMQAEAQRRGIPVQALGMLAQIGIPIAGLGGQSTGQSQGTQQMSGAQQFGQIASGIGNILGGAGNFMKFMPSDRRLKQDIEQVGMLFDGQPVYGYYYRGHPTYTIGLIAQEVAKVHPGAVAEVNGFSAVDYHAATAPSRKMKKAA